MRSIFLLLTLSVIFISASADADAPHQCNYGTEDVLEKHVRNPKRFMESERFLGCVEDEKLKELGFEPEKISMPPSARFLYTAPRYSVEGDKDNSILEYLKNRNPTDKTKRRRGKLGERERFGKRSKFSMYSGGISTGNKTDCDCLPQDGLDDFWFNSIKKDIEKEKKSFQDFNRKLISKQYEQLAQDFLTINALEAQGFIEPTHLKAIYSSCSLSEMNKSIRSFDYGENTSLKKCMSELGDAPIEALVGEDVLASFIGANNKDPNSCIPYKAFLDLTLDSSITSAIPMLTDDLHLKSVGKGIAQRMGFGKELSPYKQKEVDRNSRLVNQSMFTRFLHNDKYVKKSVRPMIKSLDILKDIVSDPEAYLSSVLDKESLSLAKTLHSDDGRINEEDLKRVVKNALKSDHLRKIVEDPVLHETAGGWSNMSLEGAIKYYAKMKNACSKSSIDCEKTRGESQKIREITKRAIEGGYKAIKAKYLKSALRSKPVIEDIIKETVKKCEAISNPEVFTQLACPFEAERPEVFVTSGYPDSYLLKIARAPSGCNKKIIENSNPTLGAGSLGGLGETLSLATNETEVKYRYSDKKVNASLIEELKYFDTVSGFMPNTGEEGLMSVPKDFNEAFCKAENEKSCEDPSGCKPTLESFFEQNSKNGIKSIGDKLAEMRDSIGCSTVEKGTSLDKTCYMINNAHKQITTGGELATYGFDVKMDQLYARIREDFPDDSKLGQENLDRARGLLMISGSIARMREQEKLDPQVIKALYSSSSETEAKSSDVLISGTPDDIGRLIKNLDNNMGLNESLLDYQSKKIKIDPQETYIDISNDDISTEKIPLPINTSPREDMATVNIPPSANQEAPSSSKKGNRGNGDDRSTPSIIPNAYDNDLIGSKADNSLTSQPVSSLGESREIVKDQRSLTSSSRKDKKNPFSTPNNTSRTSGVSDEISARRAEIQALKDQLSGIKNSTSSGNEQSPRGATTGRGYSNSNGQSRQAWGGNNSSSRNSSSMRGASGQSSGAIRQSTASTNSRGDDLEGVSNTSYKPVDAPGSSGDGKGEASVKGSSGLAGTSFGGGEGAGGGGTGASAGATAGRGPASLGEGEAVPPVIKDLEFAKDYLPVLISDKEFKYGKGAILESKGVFAKKIQTLEVFETAEGTKRTFVHTYDFQPSEEIKKALGISSVEGNREKIRKQYEFQLSKRKELVQEAKKLARSKDPKDKKTRKEKIALRERIDESIDMFNESVKQIETRVVVSQAERANLVANAKILNDLLQILEEQ